MKSIKWGTIWKEEKTTEKKGKFGKRPVGEIRTNYYDRGMREEGEEKKEGRNRE